MTWLTYVRTLVGLAAVSAWPLYLVGWVSADYASFLLFIFGQAAGALCLMRKS